MAAAFKRRLEPEGDDLVGEPLGHDASAHREYVRVVVFAREARGVEVVAERGSDSDDLVGGDLLTLSASAQHDAAVRASFDDVASDRDTDGRVIDGLFARRAVILD